MCGRRAWPFGSPRSNSTIVSNQALGQTFLPEHWRSTTTSSKSRCGTLPARSVTRAWRPCTTEVLPP
eukprot:8085821-Prorocentrum_lima.AAC.1